jgi:integrase
MAGQVINRGKRIWLVRVFLGRDPQTGKREYHNQTVHGNKEDAENTLIDLLKDRNAGKLTIGSASLLMGSLLDDVIADYRINGQDVEWATLVMKRLRPTFGKMHVSKIRPTHVKQYIERRQGEGRANATINHDLSMLRRSFTLAIENGKLKVAPFKIPKLEENNVRKGFFEHTEYRALLTALPEELKPVLTFAFYTGCRRGEILKLQWAQVDLIAKLVRLEPGETKNEESRLIPLNVEELYQTMAMQREIRDTKYPDCPWVFFREGRPILNFRKSWDSGCKAAGLWDAKRERPTRIFHDLRRTGVRNLVRAGVPEKVAMQISGHRTRSVFDRYNIVSERDLIDAMKRLESYSQEREAAETAAAKAGTQAASWHTIGTQTEKALN